PPPAGAVVVDQVQAMAVPCAPVSPRWRSEGRSPMRIRTLLPVVLAALGALLLVASVFAGAGSAKAAAGKAGAFKKGGTLKIAISEGDFSNVDPGIAYETTPWSMMYTTQVLLVNYPEKPGAEGSKLYPEAAEA